MELDDSFKSLAVYGFPSYWINPDGRIWSEKTNKFLTGYSDARGYIRVNLTDVNGKMQAKTLHRLVAKMFIPNPNNLPQVDHINGKKDVNNIWNLRWCSNLQNAQFAMENGLMPHAVFKSDDVVRGICERIQNGESIASIHHDTGYSTDALMRIRLRDNWTHISKDYVFPETKKQNYPSEDTIRKMCQLIKQGETDKTIREILGVRQETIARTRKGRIHKSIMQSV